MWFRDRRFSRRGIETIELCIVKDGFVGWASSGTGSDIQYVQADFNDLNS